jgi:hypothetical protein
LQLSKLLHGFGQEACFTVCVGGVEKGWWVKNTKEVYIGKGSQRGKKVGGFGGRDSRRRRYTEVWGYGIQTGRFNLEKWAQLGDDGGILKEIVVHLAYTAWSYTVNLVKLKFKHVKQKEYHICVIFLAQVWIVATHVNLPLLILCCKHLF